MRINLPKCQQEPFTFTTRVGLHAPTGYPEFAALPVVEASGTVVWRGDDKYAVVGRVWTRAEASCSRCLEPVTAMLDRDFDLTLVPAAAATGLAPTIDLGDDAEAADGTYSGEELELDPILEEQFILAIPMRILCADACRGLCARCGKNLNRDTCECREEHVDPRFEALKSLIH